MLKILKSFKYALRGISLSLTERNMKIHLLATVVVVVTGLLLGIDRVGWMVVMICVGLVLSLEMVNTAIENICNKLRDDLGLSYKATQDIRDISAGAVLVGAIISFVVAIIVFLPYLL